MKTYFYRIHCVLPYFTQKELAELSGVTLRMIQAYEQGDQDILKAEAQTVFALAKVLGCAPEVICRP